MNKFSNLLNRNAITFQTSFVVWIVRIENDLFKNKSIVYWCFIRRNVRNICGKIKQHA